LNLADVLDARNVLLDLDVPDRDACLRRMVEAFAATGAVPGVSGPLAKLIERERVMSTGIHPGIAVPHAYTSDARRTACALARVAGGVDFGSLDGGPVEIVFCILGPPEATDRHVRLLARIARLIAMPGFLDGLRAAPAPQAVIDLIASSEARLGRGRPGA
jgi:mannitol/fructose-specific phosphotransferase system IIA component (Ntr-type)